MASRPDVTYDPPLHELLEQGAVESAREILPLVFAAVRPSSVVDVGCWTGSWSMVAGELGVGDVLGVDAESTPRERLRIPAACFHPADLREPLRLPRTFDLVVAVEVAEHLPAGCADTFVDSLVRLGPVVLFSAAVPGQGGDGHLNEQWPHYWVQRFAAHGYAVSDRLRVPLWQNERVAPWYSQNLLLFAAPERLGVVDGRLPPGPDLLAMPLVHPRIFTYRVGWQAAGGAAVEPVNDVAPRALLRRLAPATRGAVRRRLSRR